MLEGKINTLREQAGKERVVVAANSLDGKFTVVFAKRDNVYKGIFCASDLCLAFSVEVYKFMVGGVSELYFSCNILENVIYAVIC